MTLFVVGNVDPKEVLSWIKDNQNPKEFAPIRDIIRHFPSEEKTTIKKTGRLQMAVQRPKAVVGVKGLQKDLPKDNRELLQFKMATSLLLQLLLGNTSKNYLRLYNDGVLDDSFGYEFSMDRGFHFADFSGDTDEPERFLEAIKEVLLNFSKDPGINENSLNLLKKKMLGKYFQSLNSLEYIANQFTQGLFGEWTLFDLPEVISSIQLKDVLKAGDQLIKEEKISSFFIEPLKRKES